MAETLAAAGASVAVTGRDRGRAAPAASRAVVDTKLTGTFLAAREVVPRMSIAAAVASS